MAELDLDAIDARARAAQSAPWRAIPEKELEDWPVCFFGVDDEGRRVAVEVHGRHASDLGGEGAWGDARFVAAAREDVPALVARVRCLEEKLHEANARIATARTTLDLGIAAADETFRTVKDDADCASTIACTLRDTAKLALESLTTMKVERLSEDIIIVKRSAPRGGK